MEILVGTSNLNKVGDIEKILKGTNVNILSSNDVNISLNVQESGATPIQNATIKALAYHRETGLIVTSMDSGLYFYGMPKDDCRQPGIYVRRVNGKELTDEEMIEHYSEIASLNGGSIRCSYYTGFSIVIDENHIYEYMDDDETAEVYSFLIVDKPHRNRTPGWPLNSLSVDERTGKYYMDMDESAYGINDCELEQRKEQRNRRLKEFYYNALEI
ncbi:non-canonical purine NTP pyrophosphatase [Anaeromicropila herbilytica]|uniref:Non-canonical purine NTP pyrophosphatase n=1 Tax=Anaeromicropila herbilytica TaxID=2785025 RepID=A0A7R7ELT9_9FIRM|nr:non-canonical purine NTP pyrophosphatase [Anaeromicropila herbilytica]BCN31271.1 hypothetical protein bsdtb5_25660 [Anaeromicropila herbilytica]